MNWFVWRQHRKQFLIFGLLFAAYAALLIPTGLHFWHVYQQTLASCAQHPATPNCSNLSSVLFQSNLDQALFHLIPLALIILPMIIGLFWGAPFLAKEYSEGTNALVWTQGVSRRKWLTVKLIWILGAAAILSGAFAAILTWWSKTPNAINMNRFSAYFGAQGIAPVAYSLFAVSFGILFGAWFRKTMVAVGIILGIFIALVLIAVPSFVRPHYMKPITVTAQLGPNVLDDSKIPGDAWEISRNIVDKNGKPVNGDIFTVAPPQCQKLIQQAQSSGNDLPIKVGPGTAVDTCLTNAGFHQIATYQPGYRYWDFQRIEAGMYLVLSVFAIGGTYWLVLKRDA